MNVGRTSAAGVAFIERHEGVVLRAYRDPAGVWTIGAGLTAASGVVRPEAGMVITAARAAELLARALRKYEARVALAMPGAEQHAFDAGVSFDFNTGAIDRASWVRAWAAGDREGARAGLVRWVRAGGRVLPGLVARRRAEAALLLDGDYGGRAAPAGAGPGFARFVVALDAPGRAAFTDGLIKLGYSTGTVAGAPAVADVRAFQADHGLSVDGLVGQATLATLERVLAVRRKAAAAAAATAASGVEAAGEPLGRALDGLPWLGDVALAGCALWALWLAWTYRDAVAGALHARAPRLAALLRSL